MSNSMEVELTLVEEILEGISERIQRAKGNSNKIYRVLAAERDAVKAEFDDLAREVECKDQLENRAMEELKGVHKSCKQLAAEMTCVMQSWAIPQEPLADEETASDFSHFADYLCEYIQYLMGIRQAHAERLFNYASHLYGLRTDVENAVKYYRNSTAKGNFWGSAIRFRNRLENFKDKVDDICDRCFEETAAHEAVDKAEPSSEDVEKK